MLLRSKRIRLDVCVNVVGLVIEEGIVFIKVIQDAVHWVVIPRKAGYCNHLRVSVCLFVCLLAGFLKNDWSDFDEIW